MKILINDLMQEAIAPIQIKGPALADAYLSPNFTALFDNKIEIDCIGIGNTDATEILINDGTDTHIINLPARTERERKYNNGLYLLPKIKTDFLDITHNGDLIGRVGVGKYRELGTNPTKELGFYTTAENRTTLSGQSIPGAGGYFGRTVDLDVRYKIDKDIYNDIEQAYYNQIMKNFPYFLLLDAEQHKLPENMLRFYAVTDKPISKLQSSTYKFLYSYKFNFSERF